MQKWFLVLLSYACVMQASSNLLFAETTESDQDNQGTRSALFNEVGEGEAEHVPVGSRALSHVDYVKLQEDRQLEDGEKDNRLSDDDENEERLVAKSFQTSHQGAFHRPSLVSCLGDKVTLEDGSVWQVKNGDKSKTIDWLPCDDVYILPNHSWFSSYYYRLYNRNTNTSVEVNLLLGPIPNGHNTHWVIAIDYFNQELFLEDGSVWRVGSSDKSVMKKWLINDTVMIGINDSWFSSKPNILINVNMLTYVTALCEQ